MPLETDKAAQAANQPPEGLEDSDTRISQTGFTEGNSGGFTDEDRAELAALREERKAREKAAADEAERTKIVPTHYLLLDDGTTVESQGVMTHFNGHAVINHSPIPAVVLQERDTQNA
jgi:hypothetical protein